MNQGIPELLKNVSPKIGGRRPEQAPRRTRRQSATALAGVPMFTGFGARHMNRLAEESDELVFEPGQAIVQEGEPGEALFVVMAGQAKVVRKKRTVAHLLPGDFFGELSALDGGPRTASVVAETPVRVLRLFRHTLMKMIQDEPQVAMKLLDGIVRRIRQVSRASEP
jgi:CRP/FNR family transcriptional regulator, cyclic AMP receptor protein